MMSSTERMDAEWNRRELSDEEVGSVAGGLQQDGTPVKIKCPYCKKEHTCYMFGNGNLYKCKATGKSFS